MKKVYLSLLVILFASASQAQNNSLGNSDPAAKKILDAVSAKFKTYKGVQAVFTLIAEDGKGKVQGNKKGTVFMKGNKYKVIITGQRYSVMELLSGLMIKQLMRLQLLLQTLLLIALLLKSCLQIFTTRISSINLMAKKHKLVRKCRKLN